MDGKEKETYFVQNINNNRLKNEAWKGNEDREKGWDEKIRFVQMLGETKKMNEKETLEKNL